MARPLRIEYPGALYHVYSRGIAGQDIYPSDGDRGLFQHALSTAVERHNIVLHAYCLMTNHYHLMVETPEGNLSRALRHINGTYTQAFNRARRRAGPLVQGRFKANLVEKEAYLLELSRYIVLNPVRARMIPGPEAWPWSSYRATAGICVAPPWLATGWLLGCMHARSGTEARKRYRAFVRQGMKGGDLPKESPWGKLLIGGEVFVQAMRERIEGKTGLEEVPRRQRFTGRPPLDLLFGGCDSKAERDRLIREAFLRHGYQLNEIAITLGLHYTTVSHIANDESEA